MSRRIALSIIATVAALGATPASADNDCLDPTKCPPAEEQLAREQRMLEERTRELREQEAQAAAEALAQQRAEERRAQELAAQEEAARKQAAETQQAMQRAAEEHAKREAAAARAAQDGAAHEQVYAREREAEEQRAAERRAQQLRAAEQQRMPNVIEPPATIVQVPAAVKASAPPKEAAASTKEPVVAAARSKPPAIISDITGVVPPISTVPPKKIARAAERYDEPMRPQKPAKSEIKRVAETPRPAPAMQPADEAPREPVRVVYRAPIITSALPVQGPAPGYVVNQGVGAGAAVVVVSGGYGRGGYHPYGAGGYRPMGHYQAYRTAPAYIMVAPDPRIISLQVAD